MSGRIRSTPGSARRRTPPRGRPRSVPATARRPGRARIMPISPTPPSGNQSSSDGRHRDQLPRAQVRERGTSPARCRGLAAGQAQRKAACLVERLDARQLLIGEARARPLRPRPRARAGRHGWLKPTRSAVRDDRASWPSAPSSTSAATGAPATTDRWQDGRCPGVTRAIVRYQWRPPLLAASVLQSDAGDRAPSSRTSFGHDRRRGPDRRRPRRWRRAPPAPRRNNCGQCSAGRRR